MDFSKITKKQMRDAVLKFTENNAEVPVNAIGAKYNYLDLKNPGMGSIGQLKGSMRFYGTKITSSINDPLLETNKDYAFSMTTTRGVRKVFTNTDCYLVLRAALSDRMEDAEYLTKKAKLDQVNSFIENNKSLDDKMKEAMEQQAKLLEELGIK